jgi:hypothetical protein
VAECGLLYTNYYTNAEPALGAAFANQEQTRFIVGFPRMLRHRATSLRCRAPMFSGRPEAGVLRALHATYYEEQPVRMTP